jgi:hypothetical protein
MADSPIKPTKDTVKVHIQGLEAEAEMEDIINDRRVCHPDPNRGVRGDSS